MTLYDGRGVYRPVMLIIRPYVEAMFMAVLEITKINSSLFMGYIMIMCE